MTPCATVRIVSPAKRDEILASLRNQARLNPSYCRNEAQAIVKQEAG